MSTTLSELQSLARLFLDDSTSTVVSDADLTTFINQAERALWQKMADSDDSFGLRESTGTLVQAQTDYPYPSDILGRNIRALYVYTTGTDPWVKTEKSSYEDVMSEGTSQTPYPTKYCCLDGFFKVAPPPDASGYTIRIAYTRQPTAMSNSTPSGSMDSQDQFAEIIALDAAIKVLQAKGGDWGHLQSRKAELTADADALTIPDDILESRVVWKYQTGL